VEVQVALVLFAVALSGVVPLAVVSSRQTRALAERFPADQTHYVVPPENSWAAKIGAPAEIRQSPAPPQLPVVERIDNGATGYGEIDIGVADWETIVDGAAFGSSYRRNNGGHIGDAAVWSFAGLRPGVYEVLVTYPASAAMASDAPYRISDDTVEVGLVRVNQQIAPSGPVLEGHQWQSLGQFVIQSGVLRVNLADDATGLIAADAVRIVPIRNDLEIVSLTASPSTESMTAEVIVTAP
jgi:hypothetical protein